MQYCNKGIQQILQQQQKSVMSQKVIHNFRSLLRHANKTYSFNKLEGNKLRDIMVNKFRLDSAIMDEELAQAKRISLDSYVELLNSLREIKRLRHLDSGDKLGQRDKINLTAARVGFQLPKV